MVGGEVVAGLGIPAGGGYFNGIVALEAEVLGVLSAVREAAGRGLDRGHLQGGGPIPFGADRGP